ncbi:glycoside hydrolase domain-containing protein [Nocardioides caeni]|nr:glycoside hydrolase domain-containing protein [Nocardioides caeni]
MPARFAASSVRRPAGPARPRSRSLRLGLCALAAAVAASLANPLAGDVPSGTEAAGTVVLSAARPNPVTPGNFTGYGFDQCETQSQARMDAWLEHSPFLAVGVYISGASRFCRTQRLLTPTWVRTQLAKGWRILPITLGPQSTCVGRFPRYGAKIDPTISNRSVDGYISARRQGRREAVDAVGAAQALGIVPGSTLWYDLEGWSNHKNATCRESSLSFLSGWTEKVRDLGYVSGVYSSAGSGMKILDDARAQRRKDVVLPDQIWIARWDLKANTSTSYLRADGWLPGGRMKQYQGGHDETWGGVRINIDRNYLDLGDSTPAPEKQCGGIKVDLRTYPRIVASTRDTRPQAVQALQCLLSRKGLLPLSAITGTYDARTRTAVAAWQTKRGFPVGPTWNTRYWMSLLSGGNTPVLKIGSRGAYVRRVQRTLQAATPSVRITVDGIYDAETARQVKAYRQKVGMSPAGITSTATWARLQAGRY